MVGQVTKIILVCGGRDYSDAKAVYTVLERYRSHLPIIRHGGARGADTLAREAAIQLGYGVQEFPANWKEHHRAAGPKRNQEMLDAKPTPWLCIAFPGGNGTFDMVTRCRKAKVPILFPGGDSWTKGL